LNTTKDLHTGLILFAQFALTLATFSRVKMRITATWWRMVFMLQTASQQAKASGFNSLRQVANLTHVKERTLYNWHKDKPELFKVVLLGCVALNYGK
tara:strand:- start:91 stop:381 length:291 start_codon:yes stop_codon:yes gene_type:complete